MINKTTTTNLSASSLEDCIVNAIEDKKGIKITKINLDKIESAPTSMFLICEGRSTTQVNAIADNIQDNVSKELRIKPFNIDGYRNSQWIVLDYGSIMVHVFLPEIRSLYNLEDLWSDAEISEISID